MVPNRATHHIYADIRCDYKKEGIPFTSNEKRKTELLIYLIKVCKIISNI